MQQINKIHASQTQSRVSTKLMAQAQIQSIALFPKTLKYVFISQIVNRIRAAKQMEYKDGLFPYAISEGWNREECHGDRYKVE